VDELRSGNSEPKATMEKTAERIQQLKAGFRSLFGTESHVYRAPGRVNLIGEHTDYNDGFVFPAAINRFIWVAIAPRTDRKLCIYSDNFKQGAELEINRGPQKTEPEWSRYISGVAAVLRESGYSLHGANVWIQGEVPIGAGLSSSAALEVAVGFALLANSGSMTEARKLARLCQKAENEYAGTRCGIMDQLASACSRKDHALLLDCRSLEFQTLPLPANVQLVICNSMVKRELAASAYNTRRRECEEGVSVLAQKLPGVTALRDVTLEQLRNCESYVPENVYKRCRHVITENSRVNIAEAALRRNRLEDLDQAMAESHRSLRDDFQVSCPELDWLVDLANHAKGIHGARMTGAGFGGCTINLVENNEVESFRKYVSEGYRKRTGLEPDIFVCSAADGVAQVD